MAFQCLQFHPYSCYLPAPEVVSSLSLEVFKPWLHVYLWSLPELESSTHILVEAGMLRHRAGTVGRQQSQRQHRRLCATWWTWF